MRTLRASLFPVVSLLLVLLAQAADGATLVVANKSEATVSLVDLPSGEVRATLPTGDGPHEVAVSPDGRRALVANYGREEPGSTLTVLDVPGARVLATIDLGEHRRPHGLAWLADGRRALVTAEASRALLEVDVDAGRVLRALPTEQEVSHMVAVTPDGSRAFVANIGSGSVSAFDLSSGERLANVRTGEGAEGIAVTPDGLQVWITNRAADTVTVLDTGSLEVIASLESASFPIRAAVTPDGRRMLISNARSGDLSVLSVEELAPVGKVELELTAKRDLEGRLFGDRFGGSSVPVGVLVDPGGERAYVAHTNADAISVVDLASLAKVGELRAGREPDGMGYSALDAPGPASDEAGGDGAGTQ